MLNPELVWYLSEHLDLCEFCTRNYSILALISEIWLSGCKARGVTLWPKTMKEDWRVSDWVSLIFRSSSLRLIQWTFSIKCCLYPSCNVILGKPLVGVQYRLAFFFVVCMVAAFGWNCQNALTSAIYVNIHINIMCWSLLQVPFTRSITAKHSGSWSQQTCAQCSKWISATWAPIRWKKNRNNNFSWVTRSYLTSVLLNLNKLS